MTTRRYAPHHQRDQACNVMASLTKTFVSPDIVLQNLEAITACSS